jgi:hypothetical protein
MKSLVGIYVSLALVASCNPRRELAITETHDATCPPAETVRLIPPALMRPCFLATGSGMGRSAAVACASEYVRTEYPYLAPVVVGVCEREHARPECAEAFSHGLWKQDFWVVFKSKSLNDRYEMFRVADDLREISDFNRNLSRKDIPENCGCQFVTE